MVIHTVRPGDTIYFLSQKYGVPVQKIIDDNSVENPERLMIGQALVLDTGTIRHTVASGQSLYSIARLYNTTVQDLLFANPDITYPAEIRSGQVIIIPVRPRTQETIDVNGYTFPDIEAQVLQETLPHLTYLSIFSYQVRPDGSLVPINDNPLIQVARQVGTAPLMVITNIQEGASFNSELAHTILTDQQVQNTLFNNVINTLQTKKYHGLDIDFEYIFPRDRDNYNQFVRRAVETLHPLGYTVTTALAPKTSGTQRGLLYEAHDYRTHGTLVDHVILMTYEWGYTYGPPRPVAPVNLVEQVLQYAVSVMPREKILMGIPNYGYDWTLPYVRGSAADSLGLTEAQNLASRVGAQIYFDEPSKSPYFRYSDQNRKQHIVWFEDARSIEAKLKLVNKYKLGGVSYWTIKHFFPQNWLVLNSMFKVNKV